MKDNNKLLNKINNLPIKPGIYQFKDQMGQILYIGKARSLKSRIQSYFSSGNKDPKTNELVQQIYDLETIQTNNELEALILESNQIKKYKPPFNIILRDDKHYPFLQLTLQEEYPRLRVARKIKKDGAVYFGPYVPTRPMRNTLRLINKYFGLRQCSRKLNNSVKRPCLNFQMGRCIGPCSNQDKETYNAAVKQVKLFLEGRKDTLTEILTKNMDEASEHMEYEKAAKLRDQVRDIQQMLSKQNIISNQLDDLDVFGFVRDGSIVTIDLFHVRTGRILGRHSHRMTVSSPDDDMQILQDFITQYYLKETYLPEEILVSMDLPDAEVISKWFTERKGKRVRIHRPIRGRKKEILKMAYKNVLVSHMVRMQESEEIESILTAMKNQLGLSKNPGRIEGFDVSNIHGLIAVGSTVVWENNRMMRSEDRRFKIREVGGIDDYAMIAEIVKRRYTRMLKESLPLPDLVLIDGGLGHVNAAFNVMKKLQLDSIDIIGIAKGRKQDESLRDRLFKPEITTPIILPPNSQTLHVLQQIRDEAHRFAITFHQKLRKKAGLHSILDEIPGIGPTRRKLLLKHFGSLKKIKNANVEELSEIKGMDAVTAHNVHRFLHDDNNMETN
ncbi:MAG: excinuclease ABC subunit C [Candidatus Schekmanbacteria bacterium RBG_13_48_7]|uniref:UvrABC system protein C n=1 Tax=Candidatus Schekmanbacteria bacterium RBG_13_48_7 TaxID=1817878 RepID=A0A1F7RVR4_9BACT|nr:MAG: excinuclease ABC subunit C [Candidatus Schekmanbacteria bacterium RBG_13_48_7]